VTSIAELAPMIAQHERSEFERGERERYERYLSEILTALGMDLRTPGTIETPRRLLQALIDTTAGYDGDGARSAPLSSGCSGVV
jgi:GTP cyclohydrolase I